MSAVYDLTFSTENKKNMHREQRHCYTILANIIIAVCPFISRRHLPHMAIEATDKTDFVSVSLPRYYIMMKF